MLAILRLARRNKHILYFDDLLGLYEAGKSRDSDLCVADILRSWVGRREVRVLAEITPEALQRLAERDRGFADQFQILRLEETNNEETLAILIGVIRQLEASHGCAFEVEALPTVIQLHRRFSRDTKFPGKAAKFLQQIAVKFNSQAISRNSVYAEFHAQSGLALDLLDHTRKLARKDVVESLGKRVIGQSEALNALADVVCVAKARLNDSDRPLATYILLGPTGVGKTQSAKTLSKYLFGSEEKLLRYDMNEFVSPDAVARLAGTIYEPDGLLTSAVRQQPYCVLLFDEIEKAHPDVFDLLLQVIGEARLTDAAGRTTDFTGAIILMTSNLGVQEASKTVGFDTRLNERTFLKSAEKFFRPEFLNRIDRIVSFQPLEKEAIRRVAEILVQDVFHREGLIRRQCVLQVDSATLDQIVDSGFNSQLGARALKRQIERQLTKPIASKLASVSPDVPMVAGLYPRLGDIAVQIQPLENAVLVTDYKFPMPTEPTVVIDRALELSDQCEERMREQRPSSAIDVSRLSDKDLRVFAIREQILKVRQQAKGLIDGLDAEASGKHKPRLRTNVPNYNMRRFSASFTGASPKRILKEISSSQDIDDYFKDLIGQAELISSLDRQVTELHHQCVLLSLMSSGVGDERRDEIVLMIRSLVQTEQARSAGDEFNGKLVNGLLADACQLDVQNGRVIENDCRFVAVSGPFVRLFTETERGTHLACLPDGSLAPIQVELFEAGGSIDDRAKELIAGRTNWLKSLSTGQSMVDDDPFKLAPVIRVYRFNESTVDLRTGLSVAGQAHWSDMKHFSMQYLAAVGAKPND